MTSESAEPSSGPVTGRDDGPVAVADSGQCAAAAIALAREARRGLVIVSRDLDPAIYDDTGFVDAVKTLAISGPHAMVRILVRDLDAVAREGHRLLELARQVSSHVQVRKPAETHRDFNEAFLVADERGFLHRQLADRFEGTVNFDDPSRCREYLRIFENMWEHAIPDPNMHRLHI